MVNLEQDIQQALSQERYRFPIPWDEFLRHAACRFFQNQLPNALLNDSPSSPNLNGLILALKRRDGFTMARILMNGANMWYRGRDSGLWVTFRITRDWRGNVVLSHLGFSFGYMATTHVPTEITLTGGWSEMADRLEGFLRKDLPAFLKEARPFYTDEMGRCKVTEILAAAITGTLTQVLKESGFREDEYSFLTFPTKLFINVPGRRYAIRLTESSYKKKMPGLIHRIRELGESRG